MPDVSRMIRSYAAAFRTSTASCTCFDKAKLLCRVAKLRIYTRELLIAFIRIRSPSKAPPVFRLEGSTEIIPMVFLGKSIKKRRTNSSTKEDFPAPPVPVIPRTGVLASLFLISMASNVLFATFGKFSAAEITRAMAFGFLLSKSSISFFRQSPIGKSAFLTKSLIIPCKPIARPSSGE